MTAIVENHPTCVLCGRFLTYVKSVGWFCRTCDHEEATARHHGKKCV
jgi:hypothetical protein